MAIYEYYCPTCKQRFDRRMSMAQAAAAVACNDGHPAERTITSFAVATMSRDGGGFAEMPMGGGGCACGGNCACGN